MSAEAVVIVGAGVVTAVGLSAAETAASVQSGVMRFSESEILDQQFEPFVLAQVPEDGLEPLVAAVASEPGMTAREARLLRLAARPLIDGLAGAPEQRAVPVMVALPETETRRPLDRSAFLRRLAAQTGANLDLERSSADFTGRAGGLTALGTAVRWIRGGQAGFVIAGGVDSYRDPYVLATLDREGRVKSAKNLDAFIPGEAAAFLLLAGERQAAAAGLEPWGVVSGVATGFEAGHLYSQEPYRGDGLPAAVRSLLGAEPPGGPVVDVFTSMNGEGHWAKEWGTTLLRNRAAFVEEPRIHHPADCFGDTGAACGPLLVALAAIGIRDAWSQAPALVLASSDRGERAATFVKG